MSSLLYFALMFWSLLFFTVNVDGASKQSPKHKSNALKLIKCI